ncbi:hypothetical protein D3C78_921410 [compost metagenome]
MARHQPALEIRRDVERESIEARIHALVHFRDGNLLRRREIRWIKRRADATGKRRLILIDNGDGGIVERFRQRAGAGIDLQRESIDDEEQQHAVTRKAAQFLDAELEDVGRKQPHDACFLKSAAPAMSSSGMAMRSGRNEPESPAKSSPFEKAPREMVMK